MEKKLQLDGILSKTLLLRALYSSTSTAFSFPYEYFVAFFILCCIVVIVSSSSLAYVLFEYFCAISERRASCLCFFLFTCFTFLFRPLFLQSICFFSPIVSCVIFLLFSTLALLLLPLFYHVVHHALQWINSTTVTLTISLLSLSHSIAHSFVLTPREWKEKKRWNEEMSEEFVKLKYTNRARNVGNVMNKSKTTE